MRRALAQGASAAFIVSTGARSLMLDLPTGATIVCTFGVVLILMGVVRLLIPRQVVEVHAAKDGQRATAS